MVDHRISPGNTVSIEDLTVENRTSNSIIVSYDDEKKRVLVVDCCLEEQGK